MLSQKCYAFWVFTNEKECEGGTHRFSDKVIVLNATSVLIFEYKKCRECTISKNIRQLVYSNCYKGKSDEEIAEMFFLKIRTVYNIISRAEREGRLDLKGSTVRPKKLTQRVEKNY